MASDKWFTIELPSPLEAAEQAQGAVQHAAAHLQREGAKASQQLGEYLDGLRESAPVLSAQVWVTHMHAFASA